AVIARQEDADVRHVLVLAAAAEGDLLLVLLADLLHRQAPLGGVLLVEALLPEAAVQQIAGADGVHADTVRREVQGDALREADPAELAGGVGAVAEAALLAALRVDLDD